MGCGCKKEQGETVGTLDLRCIDSLGCNFWPWGHRGTAELYRNVPCIQARVMLETWPGRLELVEKPAAAETE